MGGKVGVHLRVVQRRADLRRQGALAGQLAPHEIHAQCQLLKFARGPHRDRLRQRAAPDRLGGLPQVAQRLHDRAHGLPGNQGAQHQDGGEEQADQGVRPLQGAQALPQVLAAQQGKAPAQAIRGRAVRVEQGFAGKLLCTHTRGVVAVCPRLSQDLLRPRLPDLRAVFQHGGLATQSWVDLRQRLSPAAQGWQSRLRRRVRLQEDGLPGEQIPAQARLLIVHKLGPQDHVGRERIDHVHRVSIGRM